MTAFEELKPQIIDYVDTIKKLGLRDHQAKQIMFWDGGDIAGRLFYGLMMFVMGFFPNVLFVIPLIQISERWARFEQEKALKASNVNVKTLDVLMSYRIIYVLNLVPVLYGGVCFRCNRPVHLTKYCTVGTFHRLKHSQTNGAWMKLRERFYGVFPVM
jgi:uncharacterized membrane protein